MPVTDYYSPISVECLCLGAFPPVAIYFRRGKDNYILYKPAGVKLTSRDRDRLEKIDTGLVYVRMGDAGIIARHLEKQVRAIIDNDGLTTETKEHVIAVVIINYLNEVFKSPERITAVKRCKELLSTLIEHIDNRESLMGAFSKVLEGAFPMFVHCIDVTILAIMVHEAILGLHHDELIEVGLGAMFHDIGFAFLTSSSLDGPYPFPDIDYSRVKLHPHMGYNLLLPLWGQEHSIALDIVRYHHEKFDGSGYPHSSSGANIPISAQIVSICDVYSSLTTDRPFRKASTPQHTLAIMENESYIFNKDYLQVFKSVVLGKKAAE